MSSPASTPEPRREAASDATPDRMASEGSPSDLASAPRSLLAYEKSELTQKFVELGGKPFHAKIARENVLAKGLLDYELMTSLPRELRARLAVEVPILAGREVTRSSARDRTTKLLLEFPRKKERDATVETVHMPAREPKPGLNDDEGWDGADDDSPLEEDISVGSGRTDGGSNSRNQPTRPPIARGATLCVSTQVGCPVGCPFCASGQLGLVRNLEAHEILEQYVRGAAIGPLGRSVVMGMGEPLLNYANLSKALDAVHDEMGLGSRKVTVSTVGFPDRLRALAPQKPRFQLAISLHTPDQDQRDELVPAMKGVPIEDVLAAGDDWFHKTGREITYEYVLLGRENDTESHARRLVERLRGRRCTVNLIPFNPVNESPYRRPDSQDVERFRATLEQGRVIATVRWSRGVESDAACGQLRVRTLNARR